MHSSTESRTRPRLRNGSRRWLAFLSVVAMSMVGGLATVAVAPAASAAEVTNGLVLRYKLDEQSGKIAKDSSGKGRDGTLGGQPTWTGGEGLVFNGYNSYVNMPPNIMSGLASITVAFDVLIDPSQQGPYFIFGFGNTNSSGRGEGYLFATGDRFRATVATGEYWTEQNAEPTGAPRSLARGVWKHVAYTLGGGQARLYEDGIPGAAVAITTKPGDIGGGKTANDFIGRSMFGDDKRFKGHLRDFRIYDRAITDAEVKDLVPTPAQAVGQDKAALTVGQTDNVVTNLPLPSTGPNGTTISWTSSNPAVVTTTGGVTRPELGRPDAKVTLTATLTKGTATDTKVFQLTVPAQLDDSQKVSRARESLTVHNLADVRDNLTLPKTGDFGTTITWESDRPAVIGADGVVHRPAKGTGITDVVLHAKVTLNQASATQTFNAKVPESAGTPNYKGYLFSYFTGEGSANGEQLYFALSQGNNALKWRELNNRQPVLTSTLGEEGLRDPFIIRSPNGDKFYQIATDLKINDFWGWDASQRQGSKSIMVWESTDLVNWNNQRLVKVSPDTAGNTWAPEAFFDKTRNQYVVFWASKIYAANDPNHTGDAYNKMMYVTTRDFYTFSEPQPYIDYGYSVIDTTMIEHNNTIYRFSKDERNYDKTASPHGKHVFQESGPSVLGTFTKTKEGIDEGTLGHGEGPTVFKANPSGIPNTPDKWYLFVDENGGRGYVPFETTDIAAAAWKPSEGYSLPSSPRHGTVLPVTQTEYDALMRKYAAADFVESVDGPTVRTPVRTAPALPAQVTAHFADGKAPQVDVKWDAIPAAQYAKPGTFTVSGTITQSETVRAKAVVTVYGEENPNAGLDISGAEGSAIALAGTVNGTPAATWTVTSKAGVDTGAACTFADPHATATTLTCTDDGTYEVKLSSGEMSDTATVTVTNAAPKVSGAQGPKDPVDTGATVSVTASITDPGSNDTHTCKVDWADGTTSDGVVKDGKCTGTHTYPDAGTYKATVTVTDDDGGTGTATVQVVVKTPGGISTPIGTLPITGFQAALVAGAGAALLLVGGVLLILGRRRGRTRREFSTLAG